MTELIRRRKSPPANQKGKQNAFGKQGGGKKGDQVSWGGKGKGPSVRPIQFGYNSSPGSATVGK